ncbi:unnamed protein product, partial [Discosporangium mesarthrocarpum]
CRWSGSSVTCSREDQVCRGHPASVQKSIQLFKGETRGWECSTAMALTPTNNDELVQYLEHFGMVRSRNLIEALRAVDRGDFAAPQVQTVVYHDQPVRSGDVHLSAPFIYAAALEEFGLQPGMSFLNIGSGTGYLSYIVSMLVGERGINHGVERNANLVGHSQRCFAAVDSKLGRHSDIQILHGNGMFIEPSFRYDRVYVGAGCNPSLTRDYLCSLLGAGGILVAPFGDELVRVVRKANGTFSSSTLCSVCFSPIVMPTAKEREDKDQKAIRSLNVPAVCLQFVVNPWSPACHNIYPKPFQDIVKAVLLANARTGSLPNAVPPTVWMEVRG